MELVSPALSQRSNRFPCASVVLVAFSGCTVGVLTSLGQGHLGAPMDAFVNSASAWLVVPFLVGSRVSSRRGALAAGFIACTLQVVGYYAVTELRGLAAGGAILVFWSACAVIGGPVFGGAGRLWRAGASRWSGLGAAVLPAAFFSEGAWVYFHELHYYSTAALWGAIGVFLALTMTRTLRGRVELLVAVVAGLAVEVLITQIYAQAF